MKIAGKTFYEYLAVLKSFWISLFIIMILMVFIRLSTRVPVWIQTLLSVSGSVVLIRAGWASVKRYGFDLRQVAIVALFLSLAVHWSLPIFHSAREVIYLIFINSSVYTIMTIFGGLLAKMSAR
jgi:hypothetical protein